MKISIGTERGTVTIELTTGEARALHDDLGSLNAKRCPPKAKQFWLQLDAALTRAADFAVRATQTKANEARRQKALVQFAPALNADGAES